MSERTEVNIPCQEFLAKAGIYAWPNNTGAMKVDDRFIRYGFVGSPDIIGILPNGVFLGVECKTKTGKIRDGQLVFQKMANKNNALYIIARSVSDLREGILSYVNSLPHDSRILFQRLLQAV